MKRTLLITAVLLFANITLFAQISTKQLPPSFKSETINYGKLPVADITPPDVNTFLYKESVKAKKSMVFTPRASALIIPFRKDFFSEAERFPTAEGNLYIYKIRVENAQALNIYSDNLWLPEGGELYFYNSDHSKVLGAFTHYNNKPNGRFAVDYVYGDEIFIEYYQPENVKDKAIIEISEVGYFFRDITDASGGIPVKASTGFGASGECQVNVNCSEGDNYRLQQKGVVRMFIRFASGQAGFCTGTLINNTANDMQPYVYSAAHCFVEYPMDANSLSQVIFYFNYETSICGNPLTEPPSNSTLVGCDTLVVQSRFVKNGLDVALLKLDDPIPSEYHPYWCGWTAETNPAQKGVSIHHPEGDIKKIATFNSAPEYVAVMENSTVETHWLIDFIQTEHGYSNTEGGSSGSSIMNEEGLIFGALTGGTTAVACDPSDQSAYSRFDLALPLLKQYLDPVNSGVIKHEGIYYTNALQDVSAENFDFSVYPNPATDKISVQIQNTEKQYIISVLDNSGRTVYSDILPKGISRKEIDLSGFNPGIYYIRVYNGRKGEIKRITVK